MQRSGGKAGSIRAWRDSNPQPSDPNAFSAVQDFHNVSPGNGSDEEQVAKYLKSSARGLIAFGPPRTGKTQAVFARLTQFYVSGDSDFCWARAYELAALALDKEKDHEFRRLCARLTTCDGQVFLDDFDVAKIHPRYAEALYRLVYRMSEELSIVITTQTTGDELVERVAGRNRHLKYLAEGIVGRLRESCDCVDFGYGVSPK